MTKLTDPLPANDGEWSKDEGRAGLSEEGPARKRQRRGNLAEFLAASPLRGSGLVIERDPEEARPPEL